MSIIKNLIRNLSISPVDHPPVCCDRLVGLFLRGDIWVQSAVGSLIVSQKRHDVGIKRCKNTFFYFFAPIAIQQRPVHFDCAVCLYIPKQRRLPASFEPRSAAVVIMS